MGIYANKVETMLKDVEHIKENVLHQYDNWTYHVQFYMIPNDTYTLYSKIRSEDNGSGTSTFLQLEKELKKNKVIIAESGITSGLSIESISMVTLPPTNEECYGVTTTSFELNLTEVGSCSLMNKIALASIACGYESYTCQPFFISIWFEGYKNYDNIKGNVVKKIPLYEDDSGNVVDTLTYSTIMTVQNSIMEGNSTAYKITLVPFYYSTQSKEITCVNNIGEITIDQWDRFGDSLQNIEDKINERLYIQYGPDVITNVYKLKRPLKIDVDENITRMKSTYQIENQEARKNLYKFKYEVAQKAEQKSGSKLVGALAFGSAALFAPAMRGYLNYQKAASGMKISPDDFDSIPSFIRKVMNGYLNDGTKGYIPVITYKTQYLADYHGKSYYSHYISVKLQPAPGLFRLMNSVGEKESVKYTEHPEENQIEYLNDLFENNLLQKRYEWLFNGRNIDVIGMKRSENNLWYLNVGLTNVYKVDKNLQQDLKKTAEKVMSSDKREYSLDIEYKPKGNHVNGVLYIDDLYDMMTEESKKTGVSKFFGIALANDPLASLEPDIEEAEKQGKDVDDYEDKLLFEKGSVATKIGMQNVFQWGGQKMKIDMDIIGDPYWLFYSSDGTKFTDNTVPLPHIIVCSKSFYVNDGMDNYKVDPLMELNTIYMITKITSSFDHGKFTQKLEGFVATPFIQESYSSNGITNEAVKSSISQRAKSAVFDNTGKVI